MAGRVGHNRARLPMLFDSEGPTSSRWLRRLPGGPAFIAFVRGSDRTCHNAAIRMYGSHTSEKSMLAEGGVIERDFGKGDEERLAYSSV